MGSCGVVLHEALCGYVCNTPENEAHAGLMMTHPCSGCIQRVLDRASPW